MGTVPTRHGIGKLQRFRDILGTDRASLLMDSKADMQNARKAGYTVAFELYDYERISSPVCVRGTGPPRATIDLGNLNAKSSMKRIISLSKCI